MSSVREQAEAAVVLADRELSAALPLLRAAVASLAGADPASRSLVHRALGHALLHGGRADEAVVVLRSAVRLAERSGEPGLAAPARTKLAFALHLTGRLTEALGEADRAVADASDEVERARAMGTRALIHRERGSAGPALADLDSALVTLRRSGDDLGVQRVLINRAIVRVDTGACAAARSDLEEAELLATRLGRPGAVALIASNLGYAAGRAGDIPRALAEYGRAEAAFRANGLQVSGLLMDRAELLHATGLNAEAMNDASAALVAAGAERRTLRIPEARLLLARVAAAAGEHRLSQEFAVGEHMFDDELYLVRDGSQSPLPLGHFVQLRAAPSSAQFTTYFYNRTEGTNVRMVSYQYGPESELQDDVESLRADFGGLALE